MVWRINKRKQVIQKVVSFCLYVLWSLTSIFFLHSCPCQPISNRGHHHCSKVLFDLVTQTIQVTNCEQENGQNNQLSSLLWVGIDTAFYWFCLLLQQKYQRKNSLPINKWKSIKMHSSKLQWQCAGNIQYYKLKNNWEISHLKYL